MGTMNTMCLKLTAAVVFLILTLGFLFFWPFMPLASVHAFTAPDLDWYYFLLTSFAAPSFSPHKSNHPK
jgi:hypothetical protein